jgi:tetratricopeptide (TPR) repeat protein
MSPWTILGIEETRNKKEIKKAYARQLKIYHPEDDPNGFMRLRAAYEEALRLSAFLPGNKDNEEENQPSLINPAELDHNPTGRKNDTGCCSSLDKAMAIYNDIIKRRDVECWKELFMGFSLDEYEQFYNIALTFFNEHFHLPFNVWRYLDSELSLCSQNEFLWTDLVEYDSGLSFDCFSPEVQCDFNTYTVLRYKSYEALKQKAYHEAIQIAAKAETLFDRDPSLQKIKGIALFMAQNYDEAIKAFSQVLETEKEDMESLLYRGRLFLMQNNYSTAYKDFSVAIEIDKKCPEACKGIAFCLAGLKKVEAARKFIKEKFPNEYDDLEIGLLLNKLNQRSIPFKIQKLYKRITTTKPDAKLMIPLIGAGIVLLPTIMYLTGYIILIVVLYNLLPILVLILIVFLIIRRRRKSHGRQS